VAAAVASLRLKHVVVTSVTRDDLPDGGAATFAATVRAIRNTTPEATVEVLIPDFQGSLEALRSVVQARPDVINHNLETVPRLYPALRPAASYTRSLELLRRVADLDSEIVTKSGIMVGVGEELSEVLDLVRDLARVQVTVLTIGQYLRPSPHHHPVHRFVHPQEFIQMAELARTLGMKVVVSGPLVRSSYRAGEVLADLKRLEK
jgi:lipoic acid synthetase